MTRFWLVELDGGLDRSRRTGIWHALRLVPGVRSVTDIAAISPETLSAVLLQPEPVPEDRLEPAAVAVQMEFVT